MVEPIAYTHSAKAYIRTCVLCGAEIEPLQSQSWFIPRLGERQIGFGSCRKCGLVMQSPSVCSTEMMHYYKTTAVYTKKDEQYEPTEEKRLSVRRNISDITNLAGTMPYSVFQVGCSDGYTLSQYRQHGASYVTGVDPSKMNNEVAKNIFGVHTIESDIEHFSTDEKFDLVVLTHILEHLYEPKSVLEKCASFQEQDAWLLAEVPLLEREDLFPTGYFSFEHINYFSEPLFCSMIEQCGYEIELVSKVYRDYRYPAITVIAKKGEAKNTLRKDTHSRTILQNFIHGERASWNKISERVSKKVTESESIYLWGAGIHTAQLLANTDIQKKYGIINLVDSSETKWGLSIQGIKCVSPHELDISICNTIVISTCASEDEVYRDLQQRYGENVSLVRLYHDD